MSDDRTPLLSPEDAAASACYLLGIEATCENIQRVLDLRNRPVSGYRDTPGVINRANGTMTNIRQIIDDYTCPPEVRLVRIAEVVTQEPILTDGSTAAARARRDAARWAARRVYLGETVAEERQAVLFDPHGPASPLPALHLPQGVDLRDGVPGSLNPYDAHYDGREG